MEDRKVKQIVIVGGGTAGWMAAAALSELLPVGHSYRLIESDQISNIGVGEATIPSIRNFNLHLGIDENDFIRATQGTFKLGIEFVNWGKQGDNYIHGFGSVGRDQPTANFFHYWLKMHQMGHAPSMEPFSINTVAARMGRFSRGRPDLPNSPLSDLSYAFHFDAGLYARYLRTYSEARGVQRTEGKIVGTVLRESDGFIEAVVMENGQRIEGDFFIDCSGLVGLLIEQALHTGYEDWSHWLPCDRAIAVPCETQGSMQALTRSTAHSAGWQWRIPLQHRVGNGHVFSSKHMDGEQAEQILINNIQGEPLTRPRVIKFKPGPRRQSWKGNVIAIGLSSGFLEPIESTSIHLIQRNLIRLMQMFPADGICRSDIDEYNTQVQSEIKHIRDFIILHYKVTKRSDTPYWEAARNMEVPASLQHRIDLFRETGRVFRTEGELFTESSWLQVMLGQGLMPEQHHQTADLMGDAELSQFLNGIRNGIERTVKQLPSHQAYLQHFCRAQPPVDKLPPPY
jgi:tryptophan 7-halogenase